MKQILLLLGVFLFAVSLFLVLSHSQENELAGRARGQAWLLPVDEGVYALW